MKGCIFPFLKKCDFRITKKNRGITHTTIAADVYCASLPSRIRPKVEQILRKNQNVFQRNRFTTSQILTIRRIIEGIRAKNLQTTFLFVNLCKAFHSIPRGKLKQIQLTYSLPQRNCYRNSDALKIYENNGS